MPPKSNAKGSGAKSQAKPFDPKDASRAVTGQNIKTSAEVISQSTKQPSPAGPKRYTGQAPIEADAPLHQSNDAMSQAVADDLTKEAAGGNRKKQKRRMKEAAKKAAEQTDPVGSNHAQDFSNYANKTYQVLMKQMASYNGQGEANGYDYEASDYDDADRYEPDEGDDMYYTDEAAQQRYSAEYRPMLQHLNGHLHTSQSLEEAPGGKSKKKKRNKTDQTVLQAGNAAPLHNHAPLQRGRPGQASSTATSQSTHNAPKDRIWNTSTAEERERIKEFWLSLGEEDRRSLVKVEKEAVLNKMKEQQKHSCSCTVCGRKRTAIEEELEVLYDAYYEELEQYANHQQINLEDGGPMIPPPRMYHPMSRQPPRAPQAHNRNSSSRGRIQEIGDEDDVGDEDEDSEVGEDDELSEDYDETQPEPPNPAATDFFNFGNSLTVQGASYPTHQTLK